MKIIFTSLAVALCLTASAQKDSTYKKYEPPMMVRSIGVSFQEFEGLNARIANRPEYKSLRDYTAFIGLGWMRAHHNIISGLDLYAASSMSGDRQKRSSTLRSAGVGIDLGYDVIASPKFMLYPMVGIEGSHYMARFFKDNSAVPFNDVLQSSSIQNSIRSVDFKNSFFSYRLGIGFALQSPNHGGTSIGIQARYVGSFKDKAWRSSENQELAGAPEDKLSKFQVGLVLTSVPFMRK